jgi:type III pantothenate kinase
MLLCLDIGNSQIYGGVFEQKKLCLRFRHDSKQASSSDQLGIFLKAVLRENTIEPDVIKRIAVCSVVPNLDYSVRSACLKYFNTDPFFLKPEVNHDLIIEYINPSEVGADRIANAIAASHFFKNENIIVVDLGTATTFDVITDDKRYLGGAILPGMRLSMEALQTKTAKLSAVEIIKPKAVIGKTTMQSIQAGLYYGQVGMIREISERIAQQAFAGKNFKIIGTGGFAALFEHEKIFAKILPDLVLEGLRLAYEQTILD